MAQAEYIKETQPTKYRHEYLGEAVGNGTQVFENLVLEPIDGKTIRSFDRPLNGVDWGWYPDAWAYNRVQYDAARRTLYIYDELTRWRTANRDTAHLLLARGVGTETGGPLTADSAEPKSCGDYRAEGLPCREAVKGPGSVNQSMKWLQSLAAICIDPKRCPTQRGNLASTSTRWARTARCCPATPTLTTTTLTPCATPPTACGQGAGPDAVDVVQVYGIALEKGEYDSSDYANSLNWLWSRMKDMVADLRQTLKGGDAA